MKNFTTLTQFEHEEVLKWRNSDFVRQWQYSNAVIDITEHNYFVEQLKSDSSNLYWKVADYGVIYLNKISEHHRRAYLGIYANPFSEKKGKGTHLLNSLLSHAFEKLDLHTIKLEVFSTNELAIRLYEKLGFREEGRLRDFVFRNGNFEDVLIFGVNADEFMGKRPASPTFPT